MGTLEEKLEKVLERIDVLESKSGIKQVQKSDAYIGKWLKHPTGTLSFVTSEDTKGHLHGYGSNVQGEWFNYTDINSNLCVLNNVAKLDAVKATREEVEYALFKEAKKRGFKCDKYIFDSFYNTLIGSYNSNGSWEEIFNNGKWAEVGETTQFYEEYSSECKEVVDKFAELKEAHKNGATIQYLSPSRGKWEDVYLPTWRLDFEYRIKPIEELKIGDVCKFWDDYEDEYIVGIVLEIEDRIDYYYKYGVNGAWYKNAKVLTQEEVIKLLFNK